MAKGIDVRATSSELLFRAFLLSNTGAKVTSGTTTLRLYELQMSDGALLSYDFNDHTFKSTALTTETVNMTHRTGNNGSTNTGVWTYRLATLTGFTAGNVYFTGINNSAAAPNDQMREFQFGSAQGDLSVDGSYLEVDLERWRSSQPNVLQSGRVDSYLGAYASTLAPGTIQKNVALANFQFKMIDEIDGFSGLTGLTVTAQRCVDNGSYTNMTNNGSVTEIAHGWYRIDLAQADTNGNVITYRFTATGALPTEITVRTGT